MQLARALGIRIREALRRYFFAGLLVFLPLVVTLWFLGWVISLMDRLLPAYLNPSAYLPFAVPGLGALITLMVILVLGFFATSVVTHKAVASWEELLGRIPVFRGIYGSVRRLVELVLHPEKGAKRVVLIEYPRKGMYTIGFAMGPGWRDVEGKVGDRLVSVFVATTPNPTTGMYLLVPAKDVVPLDLTFEEALKLIASGGMITPEERAELARRTA